MSESGIEIEAKFYVADMAKIEARLQALGAELVQARIFERNVRYDLPDGSLRRGKRVLRLRQDKGAILTYKGPGTESDGIRAREELEVQVSDFDRAGQILEALGYEIILIYEKYRRTYRLGSALIMLDELPLGNFVEIEADSPQTIYSTADRLGLDRGVSTCDGYQRLFELAREALGLKVRDLSFRNFERVRVTPVHLGLKPAD